MISFSDTGAISIRVLIVIRLLTSPSLPIVGTAQPAVFILFVISITSIHPWCLAVEGLRPLL